MKISEVVFRDVRKVKKVSTLSSVKNIGAKC